MIEALHFIFSSFWIWIGAVILIAAIAAGASDCIIALRKGKQ